jgi:hypothetical protein
MKGFEISQWKSINKKEVERGACAISADKKKTNKKKIGGDYVFPG